MSKYLYNGVEFEELPELSIWPYQYKTIWLSTWGDYLAVLSDSAYQYVEYVGGNGQLLFYGLATAGNGVILRQNVAGNWVVLNEFEAVDSPEFGVIGQIDIQNGAIVIWTNHPIRYEDGSIYRGANDDPIPVEPEEPEKKNFCLKSWLTGFALDMAGKLLPLTTGKREPVAYLYKGVNKEVILPKLPEVEGRPNEIIIEHFTFTGNVYYAYQFSDFYYGTGLYGNRCVACPTGYVSYSAKEGDKEWTYVNTIEKDTNVATIDDWAVWANFDVVDENGDVVLPKSDPIPVYDTAEVTTDG